MPTANGAQESLTPSPSPVRGRGETTGRRRVSGLAVGVGVLGGALLLFLALPLVSLVWRAWRIGAFGARLPDDLVLDALRLSATTTALALAVSIALGTPLAWVLARREFVGRRVVETLVDLPLVLPPVVAGVALLTAFGRRGLLGGELGALGISLPFSTAAVVVAQVFVAAPFFVRSARTGFAAVQREVEEAAAIDGAGAWRVFRDITWPLARQGAIAGAVLCWARALSEFGATLLFAGNLQGRTQTMPLAIMSAFEGDLTDALALSVILLAASAAVLAIARAVVRDDRGDVWR
jgi:molybdate transport system permease protein